MLAKSTRNLFRGPHAGKFRQWTRSVVSVLVLIAGLTALALILRDQHGASFQTDFLARILPFGVPHPGRAEADAATTEVRYHRVVHDPNEGRYRALAEFLAKRYQVSQDVTFDLVSFAHDAGQQLGLDPLLIIAVIAVESRFNPIAESVSGAKGLMQVIPKYHTDKLEEFGGEKAVFDPQTNILVGSQILKEYLGRTGSVNTALQMYAGASSDEQDAYTTKVMNEKQRLQQIVKEPAKRKSAKTSPQSVRVAKAPSLEQ